MRQHTGPPFPSPTIDDVRRMRSDTEERREAKRAAAERWLRQFCARARFVLEIEDLRVEALTQEKCAAEIDKARPLLPESLIIAILSRA
ncbi:hypothetical protein A2348_05050 [Candidatus Uhrbacteria bacterium RIFOXYB12_FULL_58_10]|uniref:Uncharacterized protein n=1 Tax=Candidatus Uhrbacteria bacterium RIFOXYB2_FULL_57_15 TaxID=1802422 RepID=A0A1F7W9S6_9BACT|nr:MAG: hypothetical protein A2348_05050 [Candidatus Uhrbacteria bacterium RIFOXYB12_FULL_58_10]OGL98834.1 MAG: hypothetical protein A2304_05070 [Candidatus Uhrbacteria bacterium RIFOXYB2_FULL_57_15]OGM00290.1 MAG: hypothetical protein A2501_02030 [Candidatus Uhrbacteria bacterium RIFOXYC12_FULL_57_11]